MKCYGYYICFGMLLMLLFLSSYSQDAQAKPSDYEIVNHVLQDYTGSDSVITVPDGVTAIGENAFSQSGQITEVILPDSVNRIDFGAFQNCGKLESINLPKHLTYISNNTFDGCYSLKGIELPDSIISIGDSAFMNCSGLEKISIPDRVVNLGWYAFYGCTNLSKITIPDSIEHVGLWAFEGTKWLADYDGTALIINNLLVRYLGDDKKYIVPDEITEIVDGAFLQNPAIEEVILPDTLVIIGNGAFEQCTGLKRIMIPEGVTTIGSSAFYKCSSLEEITIPDTVYEFGENILTGTPYLGNYKDDFFSVNGVLLEYLGQQAEVTVPDQITVLAPKAFANNPGIEKIILPDSVKQLKSTCIFRCNGLKQLSIPESAADIAEGAVLRCEGEIMVFGITGSAAEEFSKLNSFRFIGIQLNKKQAELTAGKTLSLKLSGSSGEITWRSSDQGIAKVDNKGQVKALKAGKVTITAQVDGLTCTCTITVKTNKK